MKNNRTTNRTTKTEETSLEAYERNQAEIEKLLGQIKCGLEVHDHRQGERGVGHSWASVGDLQHIKSQLQDIKDQLHGTGEYAKTARYTSPSRIR